MRVEKDAADPTIRYVYGKVTDGSVDTDEQIVDPVFARKALAEWYDTGANVRQMHATTLPPAGKGVLLEHHEGDGEWVRTKVVEPVAVKLVDEGVYTGYSVGISRPRIERSMKARNGIINGGKIVEISLVDRPALPAAKFAILKAAGPRGKLEFVGKVVLLDEPEMVAKTPKPLSFDGLRRGQTVVIHTTDDEDITGKVVNKSRLAVELDVHAYDFYRNSRSVLADDIASIAKRGKEDAPDTLNKYSPSQARDDTGRFTGGGSGEGLAVSHTSPRLPGTSGPAPESRVRVTAHNYRGTEGHLVSGSGSGIFRHQVFVEGSRAAADHVASRMRAGLEITQEDLQGVPHVHDETPTYIHTDKAAGITHSHPHIDPATGAEHDHEHTHAWNHGDHSQSHAHAHPQTEDSVADAIPTDDTSDETKVAGDPGDDGMKCKTCKGRGKIMEGNRECPTCNGSGNLTADKAPDPEVAKDGGALASPDGATTDDNADSPPTEGTEPTDTAPAAADAPPDAPPPDVKPGKGNGKKKNGFVPFKKKGVQADGEHWIVVGKAGTILGTHNTEEAAKAQQAAIEADRTVAKGAKTAAKAAVKTLPKVSAPDDDAAWVIRRAHDATCPAYKSADVFEVYPTIEKNGVAAALGPSARAAVYSMLVQEVKEDGGSGTNADEVYHLGKAYGALNMFLSAESAEGAPDASTVGDILLAAHDDLHAAFKVANDLTEAKPDGIPKPSESITPGQFRRGYISDGHQQEKATDHAADVSGDGKTISASDYTRGPLTDGHQRYLVSKMAEFHDEIAMARPDLCRIAPMDADGSFASQRQPGNPMTGTVPDLQGSLPHPVTLPPTIKAPGEKGGGTISDEMIAKITEPLLTKINSLESTVRKLAASPDPARSATRGVMTGIATPTVTKAQRKAARSQRKDGAKREYLQALFRNGDPETRLVAQRRLARMGVDFSG
jgi:hypothetical protein